MQLSRVVVLTCTLAACGDDAGQRRDDGDEVTDDITDDEIDIDAPPGPAAISVTLVAPTDRPAPRLVAFQDGDAEWVAVSAGADGVYRSTTTTGRWGFQVICDASFGSTERTGRWLTIAEATDVDHPACPAPDVFEEHPFEITGTVSNAGSAFVEVVNPWREAYAFEGNYTLPAEGGASSVFVRATADYVTYTFARRVLANITANTTVNFDLVTDGHTAAPTALALAGTTPDDGLYTVRADVFAAEGVYRMPSYSSDVEPHYYAMPTPLAQPGDQRALDVRVEHARAIDGSYAYRTLYELPASAAPALPAVLPFTAPMTGVDAATPYVWALPAGIDLGRGIVVGGESWRSKSTQSVSMLASPAYVATTTTLRVENPTHLDGWDASWNVEPGYAWTIGVVAGDPEASHTFSGLRGDRNVKRGRL